MNTSHWSWHSSSMIQPLNRNKQTKTKWITTVQEIRKKRIKKDTKKWVCSWSWEFIYFGFWMKQKYWCWQSSSLAILYAEPFIRNYIGMSILKWLPFSQQLHNDAIELTPFYFFHIRYWILTTIYSLFLFIQWTYQRIGTRWLCAKCNFNQTENTFA